MVTRPDAGIRFLLALTMATAAMVAAADAAAADDAVKSDAEPPQPPSELQAIYDRLRPLLSRQIAARRIDCPDDLYKFLYQSVMGPAHAAISEESALAWLEQEWSSLSPPEGCGSQDTASGAAALLEPLRPDGQLVRINLEPLQCFVLAGVPASDWENVIGQTQERLTVAFVRTARAWLAELGVLRGLWEKVRNDVDLWRDAFPRESLDAFTAEIERAGWPAVHHSDGYNERWHPHYRVVALELLPPAWRAALDRSRALGAED